MNISIIGIQTVTANSNIIKCWEVFNTNSRDVAVGKLKSLESQYKDCDLEFFLAEGNWENTDFWPHNRGSIRNEHVKLMNLFNCMQ